MYSQPTNQMTTPRSPPCSVMTRLWNAEACAPSRGFKQNVINCLQQLEKEGVIDRPTYYRLYLGDCMLWLCVLLKIHKEWTPVRVSVTSITSVTYNIARHHTTILSPLFGKTPDHIQNCKDFTSKVWDLRLAPEKTMVSFDVASHFTCITTSEVGETVWND